MGSEKSKPVKPLSKLDVEITSEKVYQYLTLNIDRKANELMKKEFELRDKLKAKNMAYEDIVLELSSIVNIFKYIKAAKIVRRYCQTIKEHSVQIVEACSTRNFATVRELVPYFEGIVWASEKLNLNCIKEFNAIFYTHFGPEAYKSMRESRFVDNELRGCFASIEPTPPEVNEYLIGFLQRHKLSEKYEKVVGRTQEHLPKPQQPVPRNPDIPLLPPAPQGGATPFSGQNNGLVAFPNEDFDAMINDLRDDNPVHTPAIPTPAPFLAPTEPQPSPSSFGTGPGFGIESKAFVPPPPTNLAPQAPKKFDKVQRVPVAGPGPYTTDGDENCEEFGVDEMPFSVRIHELRENKV